MGLGIDAIDTRTCDVGRARRHREPASDGGRWPERSHVLAPGFLLAPVRPHGEPASRHTLSLTSTYVSGPRVGSMARMGPDGRLGSPADQPDARAPSCVGAVVRVGPLTPLPQLRLRSTAQCVRPAERLRRCASTGGAPDTSPAEAVQALVLEVLDGCLGDEGK